ncbi:MAG: porin [bacterium]|jgi:phosphate-selective porin OprO/OprP
MTRGTLCGCLAIILTGCMSAHAQDVSVQALLQKIAELEQRVQELESRTSNQDLDTRVTELEQKAESAVPVTEAAEPEFNVQWKDGLRFDTPELSVKVGGRLFYDMFIPFDDADIENSLGGQEWGDEFRTARIHFEGVLFDHYWFKTEYDFANGNSGFKDVYIGLTDMPWGNVRIGHFKEPFSQEEITSNRYITFMERSLANTFVPARNTGIMYNSTFLDDRMTLAVGAFHDTDVFEDDTPGNNAAYGDDYSFTGRVTGVPYSNEDATQLVHLGGAYSYRDSDSNEYRFRQRPEAHLSPHRLVDTGTFMADEQHLLGAEAAGVIGPFSLQSEFIYSTLDTEFMGDADLYGWYVFASYFLTGESRPYKTSNGTFDRIRPNQNFLDDGGMGAWEIALRYSSLDLDDVMRDAELDDITAALNWYLNPNYRIMWNYVFADSEQYGEESIFQMRVQMDF